MTANSAANAQQNRKLRDISVSPDEWGGSVSQNPKSEARNPKQIPSLKHAGSRPAVHSQPLNLEFVSCFGFRISCFGFGASPEGAQRTAPPGPLHPPAGILSLAPTSRTIDLAAPLR